MNISQEFFKSKKIAELCFHSWPKLWRWTEDNFWILRNSRGHHMEIWMGKKMVGNVQAVSFTMQNSSMKSCNIRFIHKRENCNKWVQKVWKQKVSLSPIRQLKKSDKKLMILGPGQKNVRVSVIIHIWIIVSFTFQQFRNTWPSSYKRFRSVPEWISPKRHLDIKMLITTKKQQHLIKYYRWWLWEWSDQARKMFSSRKLRKLYDWTYPSDFRFSPTAASLEWTLLAAAHLVMGKAWNRVVKTAGKPKAHLSKIATEEATENCLGNSHPQQNPMHV